MRCDAAALPHSRQSSALTATSEESVAHPSPSTGMTSRDAVEQVDWLTSGKRLRLARLGWRVSGGEASAVRARAGRVEHVSVSSCALFSEG